MPDCREEIVLNALPELTPGQLQAVAFCPVTVNWEQRPTFSSLQPPLRELDRVIRSPPSLLFSRLNSPSSLSCSPQDLCSRPLSASLPFSGHAPGPQCLSCRRELGTERSTQDVASLGLITDETITSVITSSLDPAIFKVHFLEMSPGHPSLVNFMFLNKMTFYNICIKMPGLNRHWEKFPAIELQQQNQRKQALCACAQLLLAQPLSSSLKQVWRWLAKPLI